MPKKDLLARVFELRDALAALEPAPVRTPKNRALHDAWKLLLAPRIPRLRADLETLARPANWRLREDDSAEVLHADRWPQASETLARVHAELSGALAQFLHLRVTAARGRAFGVRLGARPILRPDDRWKHLRQAQDEAGETLRARLDAPGVELLERIEHRLHARQRALHDAVEATQRFAVLLAKAEERRLTLQAGDEPGDVVSAALAGLRRARRDLASFSGRPSAGFAAQLGEWLTARSDLASVLAGAPAEPQGSPRVKRRRAAAAPPASERSLARPDTTDAPVTPDTTLADLTLDAPEAPLVPSPPA